MSRFYYDKQAHDARKNSAAVRLNKHELKIDDVTYNLSAVIVYQGRSARVGHYTIFREHDGEWYEIDDRVVSKMSKEAINEPKNGQCAMLLFKKQ